MIITRNDEFEILAEIFRKETGLLAPGKDAPMCDSSSRAERVIAWDKWILENIKTAKKVFNAVAMYFD